MTRRQTIYERVTDNSPPDLRAVTYIQISLGMLCLQLLTSQVRPPHHAQPVLVSAVQYPLAVLFEPIHVLNRMISRWYNKCIEHTHRAPAPSNTVYDSRALTRAIICCSEPVSNPPRSQSTRLKLRDMCCSLGIFEF